MYLLDMSLLGARFQISFSSSINNPPTQFTCSNSLNLTNFRSLLQAAFVGNKLSELLSQIRLEFIPFTFHVVVVVAV